MLALVDGGSLRSPSGGDAAGALLSLRGGAVFPGDPHLGGMGTLSSPSACPGAMTPAAGVVLPGEVWRWEPPACAPLRLSVKHGEVNINFIMGKKKSLGFTGNNRFLENFFFGLDIMAFIEILGKCKLKSLNWLPLDLPTSTSWKDAFLSLFRWQFYLSKAEPVWRK